MMKNVGKICNASDAYIKATHHHILQKQLPIQRVKNKAITTNISLVNQVSPPRPARQKL